MQKISPTRPSLLARLLSERLVMVAALGGLAVAVNLAAPVPLVQAAGGPDTLVYLANGQERSAGDIVISAASHEKVEYSQSGRTKSVAGNECVRIVWGDAPREYARGWLAVDKGDGTSAVREFQSSLQARIALKDTDQEIRAWIEEYAQIGLGEGLRLLGTKDAANYAKAIEAYDAGLKKNPKSLLAEVALSGKAECYLRMDKASDALRMATELEATGKTAKLLLWELRGLELTAHVMQAQGRHADASRAYQKMEAFAESSSAKAQGTEKVELERAQRTAAARGGWVLLEQAIASSSAADYSAAKSLFDGLATKYRNSRPVMAAVTNAYGVIEFEKSGGDKVVALRLFETAEVKYFGDAYETARSLYYQAKCLDSLGNKDESKARLANLRKYHSKSEWAQKAQ